MFGKNPVRKQNLSKGQLLHVQEIFRTIQGEGPHAGRPAFFIRLAGCNLRCHFCDTDFESNYDNALTVSQIMEHLNSLAKDCSVSLVVITGGEPLLQNITPLIKTLRQSAFDVQIETAGTVWVPELEPIAYLLGPDFLVCSPKTPKVHTRIKDLCAHWKYIATSSNLSANDGLPIRATQIDDSEVRSVLFRPNPDTFHTIWLQPMDEGPQQTSLNTQAAVDSCIRFGYRLSVQVHKMVGLP